MSRIVPMSAAILAATCWGISWPLTKRFVGAWPGLDVAFLASAGSAAVLWSVELFAARRRPNASYAGARRANLMIGLVEPGLATVLFYCGLAFTTASASSLIDSTQSLFTACLAVFVLRERNSRKLWWCVAIATGGIALALEPGIRDLQASDSALGGDALVLFGTLAASSYTILVKRYVPQSGAPASIAYQSLSALALIALADLTVHLARPALPLGAFAGPQVIGLLALGVLANAAPFALFNAALRKLSAARASLALTLVPIVAIAGSAPLLGERLGPAQVAGAVIVIGCVFYASSFIESPSA